MTKTLKHPVIMSNKVNLVDRLMAAYYGNFKSVSIRFLSMNTKSKCLKYLWEVEVPSQSQTYIYKYQCAVFFD